MLQLGLGSIAGLAAPAHGWATPVNGTQVRRVAFDNLHTGETVDAVYWENGAYAPDAIEALYKVMRDYRTGEVHPIDTRLFDLLNDLHARVETTQPFQLLSGYRSPATNAMLRGKGEGVAGNSLHIQGMAIDICIEGMEPARLRDAALTLQRGGVGYYPKFVHLDVGPVRRW